MMMEISLIRDIVAIFGVIAGFSYYVLVVRANQKNQELTLKAQQQQLETRQAQLFMSIYSRVNEISFWTNLEEIRRWEWDDFDDYVEKYESNLELKSKYNSVGTFFEGLGVMVKRHHIDVTLVDDLLSGPLMGLWQKFEPVIFEARKRRNMPTMWEWFEYLYDRVKEVSETEHGAEHVVDVSRLFRPYEPNQE